MKLLTVSYYDNYSYPNVSAPPTTIEDEPTSTAVKGLLTGQWLKVYGIGGAMSGNVVNHYYDRKAREIGTYTGRFASGGYITVKKKLDFSGKLLYSTHQHRKATGGTVYAYTDTYSYTPEDRLAYQTHKMGIGSGGTEQLMALNRYDELGQLIGKKVGGTNVEGTGCFQNVNYSYNIRGWMTGINDTGDLTKDSDPADLFAFKINYNTQEQDLDGVQELYNGNIAETYWRTGNDDVLRMYGYQYDGLNRLKDAHYAKHTGSSLVDVDSFRENLAYDKNGNITHLGRNGGMDLADEAIEIDDMTYTYDDVNPNQLKAVDDGSDKSVGFKDVTNAADYVYDANGNMTQDLNKNITGIIYNHLNLPLIITFGTSDKIEYFYQADGVKVQKVVTQGTTVTTTDYIDGIQYTNNVLDFIPTAEGYVKNTVVNGINTYSYVYNYTDHLGNVRLSYAKSPSNVLTILEENNYYPYGLKHQGYNPDGYAFASVSNALALVFNGAQSYQYKYNGKEYQGEMGLDWSDYGARNYDASIGRWMNVDPLAENHVDFNPFMYAANNPIIFIDIDGRDFYIGGNISQATEDIHSLVNDKYKSLINVDKDGKVTVDVSKLSEKEVKKDAGLLLLSLMDKSTNKFIYEVKESNDDGSPLDYDGLITNHSVEPRMEMSKSGQKVKDGFQGQVIIHPGFVAESAYLDDNGDNQTYTEPRGSTVFHELQENYERTENHLKYLYTKVDKHGKVVEDKSKKGAHQTAIDKAVNLTSKSKKKYGAEGRPNRVYKK